MSEDNSEHAAYRRKMQQHQTVLLSTLTTTLAVVMVMAMLIWMKAIPLPFEPSSARDESPNKMVTPCIAGGSKAAEVFSITANVYNTANRTGIMNEVARSPKMSGFSVARTENWGDETAIKESARIVTDPRGTNAAYTTAQHIPESVVHYNPSINDETISVVLGVSYDEVLEAEDVKSKNPKGKLTAAKSCVQVGSHDK